MSEDLLTVDNVSKKFCKDLKLSLKYGLADIFNELSRKESANNYLREGEFWAVKDVSFTLKKGDCLGLIGRNGAGKSTLLKLLTGLIKPDTGKIELNGRVSALIELGTGFSPILTGRENVYINGAILGLSRSEIDEQYNAIVAFAELADFMDTPVQSYSSGMKIRLGFAIAAQLKPDILIIDEVLAVGDVGFRLKCYNHIASVLEDTLVIIVSHSIPQIANYCNKAILLSNGSIAEYGNTHDVIDKYYQQFEYEGGITVTSGSSVLQELSLIDDDGQVISEIKYNSSLCLRIKLRIPVSELNPKILIVFHDRGQQVVAVCENAFNHIKPVNGVVDITVKIESLLLKVDDYRLSLLVFDEKQQRHLIWHNQATRFKVTGKQQYIGNAAIYFEGEWSNNS